MNEIARGKKRFWWIVTIAAVVGLLASAYVFLFKMNSSYVRIILPDKSTIYLQYSEDLYAKRLMQVKSLLGIIPDQQPDVEFRAATSIKGLKTAARIELPKEANMWGAAFSLPFPDDQFPDQRIEGCFSRIEKFGSTTAGTAFLEPSGDFQRAGECVVGNVEFYRTDETGRAWECSVHVCSPLGSAPERAPAIELPAFKALKLTVQTKPVGDKLGIGLRVHAGNAELCNVGRSNGMIPSATIRILNEAGSVVATKTERFPLLGFG